jgi:Ca2+-transporting ATPase
MQYLINFLKVGIAEKGNAIFTLFICFQLFNAFNSRELGLESIFKSIGKNKIMALTFLGVFLLHFVFVQKMPWIFSVNAMSVESWLKIILTASSVVVVSEIAKLIYRPIKKCFAYK